MSTGVPNSIDKIIRRVELRLRLNLHPRRSKFHPAVYENHDSDGITTSLTRRTQTTQQQGKCNQRKPRRNATGIVWPKTPNGKLRFKTQPFRRKHTEPSPRILAGIYLAQKSPNWGFKINLKFLQLRCNYGDNQGLVWPKIPKPGILN